MEVMIASMGPHPYDGRCGGGGPISRPCRPAHEMTMHPIHRAVGFEKVSPFILAVSFEDGTTQVIDFKPIVSGELYGPLAQHFDEVQLDEEAHTLVWPNGADFDPAILHDWPEKGPELARLVAGWGVRADS